MKQLPEIYEKKIRRFEQRPFVEKLVTNFQTKGLRSKRRIFFSYISGSCFTQSSRILLSSTTDTGTHCSKQCTNSELLGIDIEKDLTLDLLVDYLCTKISKCLGILKKIRMYITVISLYIVISSGLPVWRAESSGVSQSKIIWC